MYPVMLQVKNQRCLVVGGGGVALRKIEGLLADGARLTVVAPAPILAIQTKAERGELELWPRLFADDDVAGFALVFATTDDREVNRRVFSAAQAKSIWVNVADDPELCTFHLPARVRRGPMQLCLASAGGAPFVVRRLRQLFERKLGHEWAEWIEAAARFRTAVRALGLPRAERERRYDLFFAQTVDGERLGARVPTEAEEATWLAADAPSASPRAPLKHDAPLAIPSGRGFVSLVGAGPGDPGLLTLKARARLMRADVVVYDRLAAQSLPCDLPAPVELHAVGKEAGHHPLPQEEINALLVRLGREGKRVVRFKGGDPYIFGRGGEEALALSAAGIPFEVVPGPTSGVAAAAYAGIPISQRRESVRLTLVTAHEAVKQKGPQVRWDLIAPDRHDTLVGYMGLTSLPEVVHQLLAAGMDPETPAVMIERATTAAQRLVRAPVRELPRAVEEAHLGPPALFIIGRVVRHMETLDWYTHRPLFGQRLGLFAAGELGEALGLAGAEILDAPAPLTPAARIVMAAAPLSGWIFRTADEVDLLEEERDTPGFGAEMIAWCLDAGAAERARELGWPNVAIITDEPEAVIAALGGTPVR